MSVIAFTGFEASATMAEETYDGAEVAPIGMIKASAWSAIMGFLANASYLFGCMNNIDASLGGPTQNPTINTFYWAFVNPNDQNSAETAPILAILLTVTVVLVNFMNGMNQHTITTRISYSLVRDGGLPGSKWLSRLNPLTKNPDRVTVATFIF